jgi:hypothetical protein
MNKIIKAARSRSAIVAALAASAAGSASAAIDTAPITSAFSETGVAAGVVGAAVLVLVVGIKSFKYIRSAF